jgi:hypothetical protein
MEMKVFYSWQSDSPNNTNRGFIETALTNAAKSLRNDDSIKVEPVIDRDTLGISGSPNIPHEILRKIDECDVFVCDITIINPNSKFRLVPNPNVLVELGYALKRLGWGRIIMVMNEAFGTVAKLPFDLEKRRVMRYLLLEDGEEKIEEQKKLEKQLETQIRLIIDTNDVSNEVIKEEAQIPLSPVLIQAQKLAGEKQHTDFRKSWIGSYDGVLDVIQSAKEIFSSIEQSYTSEVSTYKTLEIELIKQPDRFQLSHPKFGSQIELEGYEERLSDSNSVSNIYLEMILVKKIPMPQQQGVFTTELITKLTLKPDIDFNKEVVWNDTNHKVSNLTAREVAEQFFDLLIGYLNKNPGGRYSVNGVLVDANGEPI